MILLRHRWIMVLLLVGIVISVTAIFIPRDVVFIKPPAVLIRDRDRPAVLMEIITESLDGPVDTPLPFADDPSLPDSLERNARSWVSTAEVEFIDWSSLPALSKAHSHPSDLFCVVNGEILCRVVSSDKDTEETLAAKLNYLEARARLTFLFAKAVNTGVGNEIGSTQAWIDLNLEGDELREEVFATGSSCIFQKLPYRKQ